MICLLPHLVRRLRLVAAAYFDVSIERVPRSLSNRSFGRRSWRSLPPAPRSGVAIEKLIEPSKRDAFNRNVEICGGDENLLIETAFTFEQWALVAR